MTIKQRWVAGGVALLAAAGLAVGLTLAFTGGGGGGGTTSSTTPAVSGGAGMAALFSEAHVGEKQADVLAHWPKDPYQHYTDNLGDECYEFQGHELYNLCFKDGVLRSKELF